MEYEKIQILTTKIQIQLTIFIKKNQIKMANGKTINELPDVGDLTVR